MYAEIEHVYTDNIPTAWVRVVNPLKLLQNPVSVYGLLYKLAVSRRDREDESVDRSGPPRATLGHCGPVWASEGHLHDHLHLPEAPSTPHRDPLYYF